MRDKVDPQELGLTIMELRQKTQESIHACADAAHLALTRRAESSCLLASPGTNGTGAAPGLPPAGGRTAAPRGEA